MKIGLLGGSFNPAHLGHINISLAASKYFDLRQIWWVIAKQNPFKLSINQQSFDYRFKNCQKITKQYPQILVKDFENLMAGNQIYTIDLLKKLRKKHPNHQFFWIMGADNILQFHLWKNWQEIIKIVPLIIIDRDDYFAKAVRSKAFLFAKKLNRVKFLKIKKSPQSSTKIRNGKKI